jgi:hypothetical protein
MADLETDASILSAVDNICDRGKPSVVASPGDSGAAAALAPLGLTGNAAAEAELNTSIASAGSAMGAACSGAVDVDVGPS